MSVIYLSLDAEIRSNEQIHIRFIDHNIQSSGAGQPEMAVYEQGTFCHVYNSFFNITRFTTYCILHCEFDMAEDGYIAFGTQSNSKIKVDFCQTIYIGKHLRW